MRLFEAIIDANHRALDGDRTAGLHPKDFAGSLPLVALTCIDPRLNPLMPEVLGVPEEEFIWLRNAGNIITSTTSSTMRSLALACSVKGGKEIAVIGHTDCKVRSTSVAELTDRFRELGVGRSSLPDNLTEFFGLFASERQNVLRGAELVRQSPLIGPKIPVHGLLADIETGKLEWLVNGYQGLENSAAERRNAAEPLPAGPTLLDSLPGFNIGEMKFPDFKIGEHTGSPAAPVTTHSEITSSEPASQNSARDPGPAPRFDPSTLFKIVGTDKKIYGPVTGKDLEQWLAEGRIDLTSLAQKVGYQEWKQLSAFVRRLAHPASPTPPTLPRIHVRKH